MMNTTQTYDHHLERYRRIFIFERFVRKYLTSSYDDLY